MNVYKKSAATSALTIAMIAGAGFASSAAVPMGDQQFAMKAAQAGMAEVADGKLALSKNPPANVRTIAQTMITDHSMANQKLMAIASSENISLPASPDPMDKASMFKQHMMAGRAFSSAYLKDQETAHKKTIALLTHEVSSGQDPRLVAFAKSTLPTVEQHLSMIESALTNKM